MAVNTTYHYLVLRLATDDLRGETINVGFVLFHDGDKPKVLLAATLNKLRAIDATWDTPRLARWTENVRRLVDQQGSVRAVISTLGSFGLCDPNAIGMFTADTPAEVEKNLAEIRTTYVSNKSRETLPKRDKRPRLQTLLKEQFKRMHVLGSGVDDLAEHLVVANVPVPQHSGLSTDFVYKNGVYRITQTVDYHVAPDSLHNKLSEVCVKSTAAELAMKSYGDNTERFAVLDIPEPFLDATDAHVDLLNAQGFEVFYYNDAQSMANYLTKAAPLSRLGPI